VKRVEQTLDKKNFGITMFLGLLLIKEQTVIHPDWPSIDDFLVHLVCLLILMVALARLVRDEIKKNSRNEHLENDKGQRRL
jgi:hypothetical protein